jgi:hypothetical protein
MVKTCVNLAPAAIIVELKALAPMGTRVEYTVWAAVSSFVHVTVLLMPITTVTLAGEKPGAADWPTPAPLGIDTVTVDWAFASGKAMLSPETRRTTSAPEETEIFCVVFRLRRKSLDISLQRSGANLTQIALYR